MTAATGVLAVLVLVAFGVQTAIGFGAMLIAVTLGASWMPLDQLLALLIPLSVAQSAVVVVRHGWDVRWRMLGLRILPLMAVGLAGGLWFVGPGGAPWLRPALGALVLVLAGFELTRGSLGTAGARWQADLALVGGGLVQALLATGGPLVVWALGREDLDRHALRSTLTAVWLVMNVVLGAAMFAKGQITPATLGESAVLLVPGALGIVAGEALHARLDEGRFRRVLWGLLALGSIPLLLGG